ncbi:MAG: hypothetical protein H0U06_08015 [Solirubrobacterales bacterium]|nr:hypothetical protein [Solirubrobacterales bacterium]
MGRTLDPARLGDHIDRHYCAACALTGSRIAAADLVQDTYAKALAQRERRAYLGGRARGSA